MEFFPRAFFNIPKHGETRPHFIKAITIDLYNSILSIFGTHPLIIFSFFIREKNIYVFLDRLPCQKPGKPCFSNISKNLVFSIST